MFYCMIKTKLNPKTLSKNSINLWYFMIQYRRGKDFVIVLKQSDFPIKNLSLIKYLDRVRRCYTFFCNLSNLWSLTNWNGNNKNDRWLIIIGIDYWSVVWLLWRPHVVWICENQSIHENRVIDFNQNSDIMASPCWQETLHVTLKSRHRI